MANLSVNFAMTRGDFELQLCEEIEIDGVLGVLGPSGSGKTSLLSAIAGLIDDVKGVISFDGNVWLDSEAGVSVPTHQRRVGYVFQNARLFPHLSVAKNIQFAADRAKGAVALEDIVGALDLHSFLTRMPGSLSGGEQQRVAIARALASNPRLLLMDEPLSATDVDRKSELLPYLARVVQGLGIPVIYVSHDLDELATLSDQLMVVRAGQIVSRGPTREMMSRLDIHELSDRYQAGSVIDAEVIGHDDTYQLSALSFEEQLLSVPRLAVESGTKVTLRIHARDAALAVERPEGLSIRNIVFGTVTTINAQPNSPDADVIVAVGESVLRVRVTRASIDDLGVHEGQALYVLIKTASVESGT